MSAQTDEDAFESRAEEILLGQSGWKLWQQMEAQHGALRRPSSPAARRARRLGQGEGASPCPGDRLVKELAIKGTLHILRHGFKFYGKTFRLAYFKPAHGLNYEVLELYGKNELTVTRQVPCHPTKSDTADLVLAINGLPVATVELKNPGTGQTWRHAAQQYREHRDPHAPLFEFQKRALVHFAVDSDEIHMTTRLAGEKTYFLPLNRGSDPGSVKGGAGNPQHPSGYRTAYFWEEVLQFDSFLDIVGHFMFVETKEEKVDDGKGGKKLVKKEAMIFPRYAIEVEEERDSFRTRLLGFVNVYAFLSQIIPFADRELEMLASFGKFLLPHLPIDRGDPVKLCNDVVLHYYRLQQVASGAINIREGDPEGVKSPTDVGTGKASEKKAPLSEIIEVLNERFGTEFSEEDRLFFEQIKEKAVKSRKVIDTALSNPLDKFQLGVRKLIEDLMIQRLADNDDIVTRYMDDAAFQGAAFPILSREIFAAINSAAGRKTIEEIVAGGEGDTTEFKSTLRANLYTNQPDIKMEHSALKTIAAFLNSHEGGTLVIGVSDAGKALGLDPDGFQNEDKMNLHLVNLLKRSLGAVSMLHIKPRFEDFEGKRALVIDCKPSGAPVFLKDGRNEELFIRAGASSVSLPPSEMNPFIKQRFST